jgi:hypothetical protein
VIQPDSVADDLGGHCQPNRQQNEFAQLPSVNRGIPFALCILDAGRRARKLHRDAADDLKLTMPSVRYVSKLRISASVTINVMGSFGEASKPSAR